MRKQIIPNRDDFVFYTILINIGLLSELAR